MNPRTSVQDVMRCDLCEIAIVQMHCDTCLVNLCKACVGEHFAADLSKPHKIVDFKDRKSTPLYPVCTTHDKQQCQMYCRQCNISVCTKCVASHQHLGHKLSEILEVLEERKDKIIKVQIELNEAIYPTYQGIASDVKNRMSQLENEYGVLSTAITKHGKNWHREIDKLVKNLKAEVDEMKNTQIQTLQKHLDEINKKLFNLREEIHLIDIIVESQDISKLLSATCTVDEYKHLPHKFVLSSPTFIPGKIHGEQFSKLFGTLTSTSPSPDENGYSMKTTHISPEAGSSPQVKQLLDEPETVTTIDTSCFKYYLETVACLSDEAIWAIGDDSTMKLFSMKQGSLFESIRTMNFFSISQGSLLKSITTRSWNRPWDIAVIKSGDLVYTDYDDKTVNIVKNEKIEEIIRLQNWKPSCICNSSSGDLLVTMEKDDRKQSKVVRYSGSTQKQTIQFDDEGKPLYSSGGYEIKHISENKNLDICVSDLSAKAIVVVNQSGKLRFRYTGHTPFAMKDLFKPRGITTDSQSHILTADYGKGCVHIIDQDGHFIRYIHCELSDPWALCTDTSDNLFVAQYWKRQVKKIKYQQ
ncbi:uncharacterized protein LOC133178164 [Saccostrea echinata]|uniref:uncharacterized protein LOC133178164 n=1 Tax=Saccostrea echinata TaxID=191078 RepID=UPI002A7FDE76|nr:uncharacterized protein LOC133178164 [Saccostrea echinata]